MYIILTRHHKDTFGNVFKVYNKEEIAEKDFSNLPKILEEQIQGAEVVNTVRLGYYMRIDYKRKGYRGTQYMFCQLIDTDNYKTK